jgi:hypothetical protein
MWKLSADDQAQRDADAEAIRDALESLRGVIPAIVSLRVSPNVVPVDGNFDLGLFSEFETADDLVSYIEHPAHQAVVPLIRARVSGRAAVDLEV